MTRAFVNLGQELGVGRFVFVSTAFSCGYRTDLIPETLHGEAGDDPHRNTHAQARGRGHRRA